MYIGTSYSFMPGSKHLRPKMGIEGDSCPILQELAYTNL